MRSLVIVVENSKRRKVLCVQENGLGTVAAQNECAFWVQSLISGCFRSRACLTFCVSAHLDGSDCDHEIPHA